LLVKVTRWDNKEVKQIHQQIKKQSVICKNSHCIEFLKTFETLVDNLSKKACSFGNKWSMWNSLRKSISTLLLLYRCNLTYTNCNCVITAATVRCRQSEWQAVPVQLWDHASYVYFQTAVNANGSIVRHINSLILSRR